MPANQSKSLEKALAHKNVSRETLQALEDFSEMLLKWNARINLVSKKITKEELWQRHILDSAQLIKYLPEKSTIADLGSGAGFPGLILAIIGGHKIIAVESDQRKCAFMREAAIKLHLDVKIINSRIEDAGKINCDVITSRALASLEKLFEYSESILQDTKFMLFLKGQNIVEEIKEASIYWGFEHEMFADAFDSNGAVIKVSNLRRL